MKTALGALTGTAVAHPKTDASHLRKLPTDLRSATMHASSMSDSFLRELPKALPSILGTSIAPESYAPPQSYESGVVASSTTHAPNTVPTEAPAPPGLESPAPLSLRGSSKDRSGEHIGQYEIIRKLGEGGMGVVYLARDTRLGRRVAIKVLRTQNTEVTRRFIIEARTTARCTHENIVVIHDVGEFENSPFMVLEYLEGKNLTQYQEVERPSATHAVEIMVSVAQALAQAHGEGIVHRDLKPDNIFIATSGTVKVLDFGIAKLAEDETVAQGGSRRPSLQSALESSAPDLPKKSTGIAGTVAYMSPEQWLTPDEVDHRADIWAVGFTLFELLTGRNPLTEQESPLAVAKFLAAPTPMPTAIEYGAPISEELSQVIARCLEKNPGRRYPDASALLKALEPFLPGRQTGAGSVEYGPFAGLRAFQEEDASHFFGRSRELGTLITRLKETPLMAAVGPSGVGKSSFLRAGVIPALKNSGYQWEVLTLRPGRSPLLSLAERIAPYENEEQENTPYERQINEAQVATRITSEPGFLGTLLRNYCRVHQCKILLFIDQFEELYTLGATSDERRAFTKALVSAADDAISPVRVLLSIRADFLGRTTEDAEFVSTLNSGVFFLGPPSRAGLKEALVRPAEMMGYRFESSEIVSEMIEFLDGSPNGLPLLQFTAAQLWEARDPQSRLLTLQSYRGMGGVEGALVSHADSVYNQLSESLQALCRTLFMYLVTTERTRAVRTMRELADLAGDPTALKQLVGQLVDSRLWVIRADEGEPTLEIVHESLITNWPSLRRWLEESHEDSVFIDQLVAAAHQWDQKNQGVGLLWRGEMVDELVHFQRHYQGSLPELADEFAKAVNAQARKSARLKKVLAIGGFAVLAALLFVASVGLFVVNEERNKAAENAKIAEDRLAEQLRAEKERTLAEEEKTLAEAATIKAEQQSGKLQVQVDLNAEELAKKNVALQRALNLSEKQQDVAVKAREEAEQSETAAQTAKENAENATKKVEALLVKETARAERLDSQIGTLIEKL